MNKKNIFEYGFYSDCLRECYLKFGNIESLPIIKSPHKKIINIYSGGKVLDIGGGKDKPIQKYLNLSDELYFSLDNDPRGKFSFNSEEEMPKDLLFSLITANQVFEHISLPDSINLVCNISEHLEKNGLFFSTVPNINHPTRQSSNVTHITNWEYKSLYMLYKYADIDVIEIARYSKRHPKGLIEKTLAKYINRIYRIDWCDSVMILGRKS